jgi:hypothetical protein
MHLEAVGDESDKEKTSAVSEETERATVGGESDGEYREAECTRKREVKKEELEKAREGREA